MSYADLPPDWPTRPVSDPSVFTPLVDLIVSETSRDEGVIYVWLCGPTDRLMQPCAVTDVSALTPTERCATIDPFARVLAEQVPDGSVVLVVARPGIPATTDEDRQWHEAAVAVCRSRGIRLAGVAVATREAVWQLPHRGDVRRTRPA